MGNAAVMNKRITKVRNPSEIVYLQEDRFRWKIAWLRPAQGGPVNGQPTYWAWTFPNGPQWGQEYSYHHEKGGNLVFVDGHAEWRPNDSMRPTDFGLTGGPGVTGTANDRPETTTQFISYLSIFD